MSRTPAGITQGWLVAGRSCERGALTLRQMAWDPSEAGRVHAEGASDSSWHTWHNWHNYPLAQLATARRTRRT